MSYNPSLERTSTKEWSLRNEILSVTHQWPTILIFCVVGGLLGWAISWIWPSSYRAREDIYVGLNIYRWEQDRNPMTFTGEMSFNYPDDYKNWQMANLNAFVLGGDVTGRLLEKLREQDPYWESIEFTEFNQMLDVYWRNAGKWTLAVEHPDPNRAAQAVTAWEQIVLEGMDLAIASAQETLVFDYQLQEISENQAEVDQRVLELSQVRSSLDSLTTEFDGAAGDEPVDTRTHWRISAIAARGADFSPAWTELLESFPNSGALPHDYSVWFERAEISIEEEINLLQAQAEALQEEQASAAEQYARASQASLGFSANMEIASLSSAPPERNAIRPTSLLMLVGAIFGFLLWIGIEIARVNTKRKQ